MPRSGLGPGAIGLLLTAGSGGVVGGRLGGSIFAGGSVRTGSIVVGGGVGGGSTESLFDCAARAGSAATEELEAGCGRLVSTLGTGVGACGAGARDSLERYSGTLESCRK